MGLVKFSVGVDRIGQIFCMTFCGSGWGWLNFLHDHMGLLRLSVGVGGIGHSFSESG